MKKFRLVPAMLALVLVFGLAFVGCDSNEEPKTIEDLFAKIKPFYTGGPMRAYKGDDTITYCVTHTAWEPFVFGVGGTHGAPPTFPLAEATSMEGWSYYTADSSTLPATRNLISALDSFYSSKYKLSTAPTNSTSLADGTPLFAWYSYVLRSDGSGRYGASATATQAPCMWDYYQF
jgi:hypothetical protein